MFTQKPLPNTFKKYLERHNNVRLYYEIYPGDTAKPILFFLHGTGGDLDAWHFVKNKLLSQGFGSIAMDLRGHGYSTHPRAFKENKMHEFVEDVIAILDAEKIKKIILIGHCYGAIIATYLGLAHPERLEKLVLMSPSYCPPDYLQSKALRKISVGLINIIAFASPPPIHPGHSYYPEGKFHKDYELFGLIRTIARNSLLSYLLASKEIVTLNLESKLHNIALPTLLVAGAKDSIFPLHIAEKMQTLIPNSTLEVIPEGNHVIILNNVDEVIFSLQKFL